MKINRFQKIRDIMLENKMRIVNRRIETDTAAGKTRYEYTISTNRAFDQESFIGAFLMLPDIQKVGIY
jgi:hypothetical protein